MGSGRGLFRDGINAVQMAEDEMLPELEKRDVWLNAHNIPDHGVADGKMEAVREVDVLPVSLMGRDGGGAADDVAHHCADQSRDQVARAVRRLGDKDHGGKRGLVARREESGHPHDHPEVIGLEPGHLGHDAPCGGPQAQKGEEGSPDSSGREGEDHRHGLQKKENYRHFDGGVPRQEMLDEDVAGPKGKGLPVGLCRDESGQSEDERGQDRSRPQSPLPQGEPFFCRPIDPDEQRRQESADQSDHQYGEKVLEMKLRLRGQGKEGGRAGEAHHDDVGADARDQGRNQGVGGDVGAIGDLEDENGSGERRLEHGGQTGCRPGEKHHPLLLVRQPEPAECPVDKGAHHAADIGRGAFESGRTPESQGRDIGGNFIKGVPEGNFSPKLMVAFDDFLGPARIVDPSRRQDETGHEDSDHGN